jgi:hypothetical protein
MTTLRGTATSRRRRRSSCECRTVARVVVVRVSELSPCLGRVAMEYLACVCMHASWVCMPAACHVRCMVVLHVGCCDPLVAASASCALVCVVGVAEACGSNDRVGQHEFMLKE